MADLSYEKVLMDTSFKNCQNIYDNLSKLLEHVDYRDVGDINQINEKILSLGTDMYNLLCIAESVFIYEQKSKGNNVTNFIFKGVEYLDNDTHLKTDDLNSTKMKPLVVERREQCNVQNAIPSNLGQHFLQATSVQKVTKSCQTSDVIEEEANLLNISDVASPQTITGKIRSEFHRNISYKDDKYLCNLCSVTMETVEDTILHIKSQEHKDISKNPSAFIVKLLKDVCSIDNFWSFVPTYLKIFKIYIQPVRFRCTLCNCKLSCSPYAMYMHISSKAHMKNVPMSLLLEYKN